MSDVDNPITCVSDGWNGDQFVLTENGSGAVIANGTLDEGEAGSLDVCLANDACYTLETVADGRCDSIELSLGYSNTDGTYMYVYYPSSETDVNFYYYSADLGMYIYRLWSQYWALGSALDSSSGLSDYITCDVLTFPEVLTNCSWSGAMAGASDTCSAIAQDVAWEISFCTASSATHSTALWCPGMLASAFGLPMAHRLTFLSSPPVAMMVPDLRPM